PITWTCHCRTAPALTEAVNRRASGSGSKPVDDSQSWPVRWLRLIATILWRAYSPALARPTGAASAFPGGSACRGAPTLLPGLRGALVGRALRSGQALCAARPAAGSGGRCPGTALAARERDVPRPRRGAGQGAGASRGGARAARIG